MQFLGQIIVWNFPELSKDFLRLEPCIDDFCAVVDATQLHGVTTMSVAVRVTGTAWQDWAVRERGQVGPVWTLTSVQTPGSLLGVQSSVDQTLTA